jgi:glucose-1-phosphate adenylyltransferase
MELIDLIPEFNLYEEYWKIYTKSDMIAPQYFSSETVVEKSIVGEGTEVYGEIYSSVIGAGVTIGRGAVVRDSIIMKDTIIGDGAVVDKSIIAEGCRVGNQAQLGAGEYAESKLNSKVYTFDLVTVGENSIIPDGVIIGKNTAIAGVTTVEDYSDNMLASGEFIIKEGDRS